MASLKRTAALLGSIFFVGLLQAATPHAEKVNDAPPLTPLALTITGRVATLDSAGPAASLSAHTYRAQWPGTVYTAAFRGSAVYLRIGKNHEILHIAVDAQEPDILTQPAPGLYRFNGLPNTPHILRVFVATESQDAPNDFGGFGIPAGEQALPAPAKPTRQIEFIGDSHTVGYGDLSTKQACTNDEVWATTDDTQALGALTAAHFHADYQVNAISGRGIVRNYNGVPAPTLPEAYPFVLFDRQQAYHDPSWHPAVIVVALGTNDFTTALHPGEVWKTRDELHAAFEARYLRFLDELHTRDPQAYLILWATDMVNGEIESEVGKVAAAAHAHGLARLTFVPMDHLAFSGCNGHPSLADHRAISNRLVETIDAQPNIWHGN